VFIWLYAVFKIIIYQQVKLPKAKIKKYVTALKYEGIPEPFSSATAVNCCVCERGRDEFVLKMKILGVGKRGR